MDFEENDNLQFKYLAGGNILDYPPLHSNNGEHLMFITKNVVNVYSTISCQFVRKLEGSTAPLIDFEFELSNDNILTGCNKRGEIFSWEWKTGALKSTKRIPNITEKSTITNFKLLNLYGNSDLAHAFICLKVGSEAVKWHVLNREKMVFIQLPCNFVLGRQLPLVAVDNKTFKNLVIAQKYSVFFVNYETWSWVKLMNAYKVPITALQIKPSEECVATGDELGKIFLWREFQQQETVKTSLYHWHHTKITSICFTVAGANFFSSGQESVMVKWNVENPAHKRFVPRTPAEIRHIVISPDNTRVVACLIDNSIQFIGPENTVHENLQEFTYITDNKTENCKYPTGLRLNPRNNSLVLNGRMGSLQFYNTYTKSLLYNVNIVNQNLLSKERERILYDISVTKAAFNIDWMATGEVFNDEEHLPELRLKFWKYQEETQNYELNTNIELPHEGGFKAIAFSNDYQVDNLLCATVGEDNIIKMWSLEDSENIYNEGKTWYCIAQTSYKDLCVDSISFSQDGSLLAAGYGNTLCIYRTDNLKLKAALTGSNGQDGCISKAQIRVPSKTFDVAKSELSAKRKKLMQLLANTLETSDESLIKELQNTMTDNTSIKKPLNGELDDEQKKSLFKKIIQIHELNLFQKALIYQKLGIACGVHPAMETKLAECLKKLVESNTMESKLQTQIYRLNLKQRFKAKHRLQRYKSEPKLYCNVNKNLVPLLSLMNFKNTTENTKNSKPKKAKTQSKVQQFTERNILPTPTIAEISHVQFAAGDYAHLVVVCTEHRILIWNLLTLRLQAVLKLSVKHLTFDPQTNLVAVVTHSNELHLFQPNVPLPIYQRRNLPNLHGIAWIPRRRPKQRSINVDWQASSTLYFLIEDQEIVYLSLPNEKDSDVPETVVFDNEATDTIQYTTFGTYATKIVSDKQTVVQQSGPLILGNSEKTAIKALVDMSVHTMPPMSLICEDLIKSMVKCNYSKTSNDTFKHTNTEDNVLTTRLNGDLNGFVSHSDDDEDEAEDVPMTNGTSPSNLPAMKIRKNLINKIDELKRQQFASTGAAEEEENKLRCMARQPINLVF